MPDRFICQLTRNKGDEFGQTGHLNLVGGEVSDHESQHELLGFSSPKKMMKSHLPASVLLSMMDDTPRTCHRKIVLASISTSTLGHSQTYTCTKNLKIESILDYHAFHQRKNLRKLPKCPDRVLDAPDYLNDFYLKLMDWGPCPFLAVALNRTLYLWNAESGQATELFTLSNEKNPSHSPTYISSVKWLPNKTDAVLAVGLSDGSIELWDVFSGKKLRTIRHDPSDAHRCSRDEARDYHPRRIAALAWNKNVLSSGNRSGYIYHSDVRAPQAYYKKIEYGHHQEVCGLSWSPDGAQLASGGNDNLVNIFETTKGVPLYTFKEHQAAVKALAWCPWKYRILASGGGTADQCIRTWNTNSGQCLSTTHAGSQVTSLLWTPFPSYQELISTHGYSDNQITLWHYPSMKKTADLKGHTGRILCVANSPDGSTIVTAGADENLNFWQLYPSTCPTSVYKSHNDHTSFSLDKLHSPIFSPQQKPTPVAIRHFYLNTKNVTLDVTTPIKSPLKNSHIHPYTLTSSSILDFSVTQ